MHHGFPYDLLQMVSLMGNAIFSFLFFFFFSCSRPRVSF